MQWHLLARVARSLSAVGLSAFATGCSPAAALAQPPGLGTLIVLLTLVVLLNTVLTAALLLGWERVRRRPRLRDALLRELGHLRSWATEEGVLRKAGLLRDLNALGAVPPELEGCELEGADLRGVRLAGCSLRGANLAGADLQGAVLDGADCFGVALAGANLALASLREASLRGCDLDGAMLAKADLRGANLHRASLAHANLQGALLAGARLAQARFLRPEEGGFQLTVHPTVEDWIRARLDGEGRYQEETTGQPPALSEAG
ncbi:MAG TPA: pentapeptide repeat-containing protein [bacterium]|nr:pentapeptide repeat-containing protein [bacterium]